MTSKPEHCILSEKLRERDISFSSDELKRALESDSGATIKTWIQEYLSADTLLTKEELALYNALEKSGELESLEGLSSSNYGRPHSDVEITAAIQELKKQTETIEKQTEILQIQQQAIATLMRKSQQDLDARQQVDNEQYRIWAAEANTLSTQVDETLRNLDYQGKTFGNEQVCSDDRLRQSANEILGEDDRLLSSLQKLAVDLDSESPAEEEAMQRVKDLCARLIKHTVEAARTRLDRVYLESVEDSESRSNHSSNGDPDVEALQEELESLYSEILPVAQISTEQQYLTPAVQARSKKGLESQARTDIAINYMTECLSAITERLLKFSEHADEYQSYRLASQQFIYAVQGELSLSRPSSPTKPLPSANQSTKRASTSLRRSSGVLVEDSEPELQILRDLGLALPDTSAGPDATRKYLADALADRQKKLAGHALNLQDAEQKIITTSLQDAYLAVRQLRESLLSETKFGTIRFVDEEIEEALKLMETEVNDVAAGIESVNVESLRERNVLKETLVERWSR